MKHFADFLQATNPEIMQAIADHISGRNAERDRKILRRRLIDDYRATKGEPPKEMLAIYNYEHKKQINRAAIIKQLIEEYQS